MYKENEIGTITLQFATPHSSVRCTKDIQLHMIDGCLDDSSQSIYHQSLVRTHHGDAVNFNSYFIFISDRHYTHIFHILLMIICLFTDIIS